MAPPAPSSGVIAQPTVTASGKLQLYCLCKSHDGDGRTFVRCEACQDYFHPACVGVTQEAIQAKKRFCCPDCRKMRRAKSKKIGWTSTEDALVQCLVAAVGTASWASIARSVPGRSAKHCRERWATHLAPGAAVAAAAAAAASGIAPNAASMQQQQQQQIALPATTKAAVPDERDAAALLLGLTWKSASPSSSAASSPASSAPASPAPAPETEDGFFTDAVDDTTPYNGSTDQLAGRGQLPASVAPVSLALAAMSAPATANVNHVTPDRRQLLEAVEAQATADSAALIRAKQAEAEAAAASTQQQQMAPADSAANLVHGASALAHAQAKAHAETAALTRALAEAQLHFQMLAMAQQEAHDRAQGLDEQSASILQLAAALQFQQQQQHLLHGNVDAASTAAAAAAAAANPQLQAQIALQFALQQQSAAAAAAASAEAAQTAATAARQISMSAAGVGGSGGPPTSMLQSPATQLISSVVSTAGQSMSPPTSEAASPLPSAKRPVAAAGADAFFQPGAKRLRSETDETPGSLMVLGNNRDTTPMVSDSFDLDASPASPATAGKRQAALCTPIESSKKRLFQSPAAASAEAL